ncbi:putative polysaccharide export protein [Candidatus Nitrospira nitrosa]|uniref:Putative polysaccharide export protein n=1 Tax=Candidatus Nitrospira nitrosa TaxID=1742972 RepID=A0A0S4LEM3_9BACT|nr:polysaccharide biosynthesis/export family protein [Candidatus Nitrospira nitrosa]CUS34331.1 putative polysaccharide export protein [Candidatus Nitrospira nitrosa]
MNTPREEQSNIRWKGLAVFIGCVFLWTVSPITVRAAEPISGEPMNAEPSYLLGPEDVLKVAVWKDDQLTQEMVVRPDGMISFPLIGEVTAAGRTAEDVRLDVTKRLMKYLPTPNVTVTVLKVQSYRIYVLGRVLKPGEYQAGHHTDVLQALSMAGGLTPYAAENDIKIIRRQQGGEELVFPFRYGDARKGRELHQNIVLQRGDVVMVP